MALPPERHLDFVGADMKNGREVPHGYPHGVKPYRSRTPGDRESVVTKAAANLAGSARDATPATRV